MNDTIFSFPLPDSEPALAYEPGSAARDELKAELERQAAEVVEIPLVIGGEEIRTGNLAEVTMPCDHGHVLARVHLAGEREVARAVDAALEARRGWAATPWIDRASTLLRVANLLATTRRAAINAATMLGQGKNVQQAEIDAACETVDFLRYNTHFASRVYAEQPRSSADQLNRAEYRPLEGFVLAVTPFNFTAIASNLPMAPALMGNAVVWKPASTAVLSNHRLMQVYSEAGLPPGVINFVPGPGGAISAAALPHPDLAGIHFTGSNGTFHHLWRGAAENLATYRSYPRLVGETGGKDFVVAHPSADPREVAVALVRGAFEYQGQKCSAVSRAYLPASLWPAIRDHVGEMLARATMGDVRDFRHFVNAVIDRAAFRRIAGVLEQARRDPAIEVVAGGEADDTTGWYVQPTVLHSDDPGHATMREEIFGPVLTVYVYDDDRFDETLRLCDETSPYGLTGAVFARDRRALVAASDALRFAAGNFYINDKPTGALVGKQPFGGGRASGTNDKAGGPLNLLRWVSPRSIKESFRPATDFPYPSMAAP